MLFDRLRERERVWERGVCVPAVKKIGAQSLSCIGLGCVCVICSLLKQQINACCTKIISMCQQRDACKMRKHRAEKRAKESKEAKAATMTAEISQRNVFQSVERATRLQ